MGDLDQNALYNVDVEIDPRDIQALNGPDAVAAFFARLGYNTDARIVQTPGNLGITESVARPVSRLELLADQEGLFQVYLFELTSVTISNTRPLARAFRNLTGNFLLVLTSDYERLDFVLLEKYLPVDGDGGTSISQKQVSVRPRFLTVERRKPGRVDLRVLRRLTWTEADPFAQYEKLVSAYTVADWSEEFFNNRALFSDYYLLERLPVSPAWVEDPKRSFARLRQLYQGANSQYAGQSESTLHTNLLEPVLGELGFDFERGKHAGSAAVEPDYLLFSAESKSSPLAFCLMYSWGRSLDGKDDQRDKETPEENPGAVVVSLLEEGRAPWAIVTNGKLWRLYSQRAHSRATNYYEIDLEEVLVQSGPQVTDPALSFRYFWLLFRRQAFESVRVVREGKETTLPFLDQLLLESEDYARRLGDRLKEKVFEEIFPHLAAGFIAHLRGRDDVDRDLTAEALDEVFKGTLTLLYRLLFLLYAESRDLLPVKEVRGYYEVSLSKLNREIAEVAQSIVDEVEGRIKKHYREDTYELYERLARLFRVIDKGDVNLNVPFYNGGLFLTEPDAEDDSREARAARFLKGMRVPDRFLARALDLLARAEDEKTHALAFIDYKSLGVRQLGSIYEGLLEFKVRVADRKLAIVGEKGREVYKPFAELDERQRERAERQKRVLRKGQTYLENDKRERKATGSYYTPDYIVRYIVEHAVGPVLEEKFDAVRPRLRESQKWHREMQSLARAKKESPGKYEFGPAVEQRWASLVDELFDVKVLDPAMGSGHFLVEAVDYVTDKMLNFLSAFPWNPVVAHIAYMRQTILAEMEEQGLAIDGKRLTDINLLKRHVLKRCIYGVDLNPMAVELARVSLWLDCFTLGAPLSFLDHHLRSGNSLIGVTVREVREAIEGKGLSVDAADVRSQFSLFGSRFAGLLLATDLMRHVGEMSDVTGAQVRQSRAEYGRAASALEPFKRILDIYTSQWFADGAAPRKRKAATQPAAVKFLKSSEAEPVVNARSEKELRKAVGKLSAQDRAVAETALLTTEEKRFFHWELEFPEVFYGPRAGSPTEIERTENGGFDAVVGNPPYDVLAEKELGYDLSGEIDYLKAARIYEPALRGKNNLYKLFICRGVDILKTGSSISLIVPMVLLGDSQAASIRKFLLSETSINFVEAFPQKDDPRRRVFPEAKLATTIFVTTKSPSHNPFQVRTHPAAELDERSPRLMVTTEEITLFDNENLTICSCEQADWDLVIRLLSYPDVIRLGSRAKFYQGEINETNEKAKGTINKEGHGSVIVRGANVTLYTIREASQGDDLFVESKKFLRGKSQDSKAYHHKLQRIAYQGNAPQNNFRRLIAAPVEVGRFCAYTVNYCTSESSELPLDVILVLLNSCILEWYFRLGSSNAHANEYQINSLPIPTVVDDSGDSDWQRLFERGEWEPLKESLCSMCVVKGQMPLQVMQALAALCKYVQEVEAGRVLGNRFERSRLAPESQVVQDIIDATLFRCYGFSLAESSYITSRLENML